MTFDASSIPQETLNQALSGDISITELADIKAEAGLPSLLEQLNPPENPVDSKGNFTNHRAGSWANFLADRLGNKLRFNDLSRLIEFEGEPLPVDETSVFYVRAEQQGHRLSEKVCTDALLSQALLHRFDPIADYLQHVEADDAIEPADLNSLSTTYLGTTDPLYNAFLRVAVLGAVHRRLNRGCQFDVVVVLKGDQGIRKSTFWKVLASPKWYCSSVPDSDKDLLLNLHSTWMYELAELENVTTKREVGQLKNLITTSSDHIRVPYGKTTEEKERNSIFVSSVNGDTFLRDETGHRRFLVIDCPQSFDRGEVIDVDVVVRDRDRIWKAAVLAYRNGELPMLPTELQQQSNQRNTGFEVESPFEAPIERWLSHPASPQRFTSDQALTLSGCRAEGHIERRDQMEVTKVLTKLGWAKPTVKETVNGVRGRFWEKVSNHSENDLGRSQVGQEVGQHQKSVTDCLSSPTDQPDQPISIKKKDIEEEGDKDRNGGGSAESSEGASKGRSGRSHPQTSCAASDFSRPTSVQPPVQPPVQPTSCPFDEPINHSDIPF